MHLCLSQCVKRNYFIYINLFQKRNSRNILRTANNIFLANGFNLNPAFRATALKDFRTDVTPTNFAAAAQTAQEINNWVAASTDNKIQNLLSPGKVDLPFA